MFKRYSKSTTNIGGESGPTSNNSVSSNTNTATTSTKLAANKIAEFRRNGKLCVEYICKTVKEVKKKQVFPDVTPGYLRSLLPHDAPNEPEDFKDMLNDFDKYIMPGTVHWLHPQFHAYFPGGNSFPNILGDMLSTATGGNGFSWASQPSLTELENIMMDWLARALDLPSFFIFQDSKGVGGGCIQNTASDAIFSTIVTARHIQLKKNGCYGTSNIHPGDVISNLVCYTSLESHSSVEKGAMMAMCTIRVLNPNERDFLTGSILEEAIKQDLAENLVPFYCCCTLGSTNGCSFDDLKTMGPVCRKYGLWMHVDAAYAGNAFILPEIRKYMKGMEYADSFDVNPYKFMLGAVDLSCLFLKNIQLYKDAWIVDSTFLLNEFDGQASKEVLMNIIDYRHFGISMSRRMRSLKLWFLFRMYGLNGLKDYIRNTIICAKYFESLIYKDPRFEVNNEVVLGLVCFSQAENTEMAPTLKGRSEGPMNLTHKQNLNLLFRINKSRRLHLVPCFLQGKYVLRFSVNYEHSTTTMMKEAWEFIQSQYVTELDKDVKRQLLPKERIWRSSDISFTHPISKYTENHSIPLTFGPLLFPVDDHVSRMLSLPHISHEAAENSRALMEARQNMIEKEEDEKKTSGLTVEI